MVTVHGPAPTRHRPGPLTVHLHNLELFRDLVQDHDLTLRELADAIGCSTGYARHIHSGHRAKISLRLARKIETKLGCPGRLFTPPADAGSVSESQQPAEVA